MTNTAAARQDSGMKFSKTRETAELQEAKIVSAQTAGASLKNCHTVCCYWLEVNSANNNNS